MRTTVTIDADVEAMLRVRMRERQLSFKEALNQTLRDVLMHGGSAPAQPFNLETLAMGFRPELAVDQALRLAANLEDEEIARKLSLCK